MDCKEKTEKVKRKSIIRKSDYSFCHMKGDRLEWSKAWLITSRGAKRNNKRKKTLKQ